MCDAEQESRKSSAPTDQVGDEVELTEANIHTKPVSCGGLIINADDWGRDDRTTNRILEYFSDAYSPLRPAWFSWEILNVLRISPKSEGLISAPPRGKSCERLTR